MYTNTLSLFVVREHNAMTKKPINRLASFFHYRTLILTLLIGWNLPAVSLMISEYMLFVCVKSSTVTTKAYGISSSFSIPQRVNNSSQTSQLPAEKPEKVFEKW